MMVSMEVRLGPSSPHWWWLTIKRLMNEGKINEKEVKLALRALIDGARGLPRTPETGELETASELWSEIAHYLVAGQLLPKAVVQELEHLHKIGRYLPIPSRVKENRPKGLALIRGGAGHGESS